ncbi:MAG: nucleoside deaminase [Bacteroidota bacterium]
MTTEKNKYMQLAIDLAKKSVENGGGPFGAVIVRNGKIVSQSSNNVTKNNDPTAHAEVTAIRLAAGKLKNFDLSDCEIYTSCEPCPMCLGAIYWARIQKIYYACNKEDAKNAGFDDSFIYKELEKTPENRYIPLIPIMRTEALEAFEMWKDKEDKTEY